VDDLNGLALATRAVNQQIKTLRPRKPKRMGQRRIRRMARAEMVLPMEPAV